MNGALDFEIEIEIDWTDSTGSMLDAAHINGVRAPAVLRTSGLQLFYTQQGATATWTHARPNSSSLH